MFLQRNLWNKCPINLTFNNLFAEVSVQWPIKTASCRRIDYAVILALLS